MPSASHGTSSSFISAGSPPTTLSRSSSDHSLQHDVLLRNASSLPSAASTHHAATTSEPARQPPHHPHPQAPLCHPPVPLHPCLTGTLPPPYPRPCDHPPDPYNPQNIPHFTTAAAAASNAPPDSPPLRHPQPPRLGCTHSAPLGYPSGPKPTSPSSRPSPRFPLTLQPHRRPSLGIPELPLPAPIRSRHYPQRPLAHPVATVRPPLPLPHPPMAPDHPAKATLRSHHTKPAGQPPHTQAPAPAVDHAPGRNSPTGGPHMHIPTSCPIDQAGPRPHHTPSPSSSPSPSPSPFPSPSPPHHSAPQARKRKPSTPTHPTTRRCPTPVPPPAAPMLQPTTGGLLPAHLPAAPAPSTAAATQPPPADAFVAGTMRIMEQVTVASLHLYARPPSQLDPLVARALRRLAMANLVTDTPLSAACTTALVGNLALLRNPVPDMAPPAIPTPPLYASASAPPPLPTMLPPLPTLAPAQRAPPPSAQPRPAAAAQPLARSLSGSVLLGTASGTRQAAPPAQPLSAAASLPVLRSRQAARGGDGGRQGRPGTLRPAPGHPTGHRLAATAAPRLGGSVSDAASGTYSDDPDEDLH